MTSWLMMDGWGTAEGLTVMNHLVTSDCCSSCREITCLAMKDVKFYTYRREAAG